MRNKHYDIAIIGAGASGLMVASHLRHRRTVVIETNSTVGKKIQISGGGRCNVTNECVNETHYAADYAFVAPALKTFSNTDLLSWLNKRSAYPEVRFLGQYFFKQSATELLKVFQSELKGSMKLLNTTVIHVHMDDTFCIETTYGTLTSNQLIVASGGLSYQSIGASGIGYDIAKNFGHEIAPPKPALVGFTLQKEEAWMKALSGITFKASIKTDQKTFYGDLLFAHKGISGPVVLNSSVYWEKGLLTLDFIPDYQIEKLLVPSKKRVSTLLPLPKRFVKAFLEVVGLEDRETDKLTPLHFEKLKRLKSYSFAPAGNFGFSKAEVTKGGVDTTEVDAHSMQSKKQQGLFFIGEVLDVTGELGGYNFQWAFSSAVQCAKFIENR